MFLLAFNVPIWSKNPIFTISTAKSAMVSNGLITKLKQNFGYYCIQNKYCNFWSKSAQKSHSVAWVGGARDGNFYLEVSALLKSENLWVTSVVNSHGKKNAAIQGFLNN